jgi:hypothetical protein
MNQIGFKLPNQNNGEVVIVHEPVVDEPTNKQLSDLIRICYEYANTCNYPLIEGEKRDRWLIERLKKYRVKYLEDI